MANEEVRLIIGDSESFADLYYATRFRVGVPVVYLEIGKKKILLVGDLEYGRARTEADVDEFVSTASYERLLEDAKRPVSLPAVLDLYLKDHGAAGPGNAVPPLPPRGGATHPPLMVPAAFSFGYAESLRELGYEVKVKPDPFFPARTVKTPTEISAIEEVQSYAEEAMELAVNLLKTSEIRDDTLWLNGSPLTAEQVRHEMQKLLLEKNCAAASIIIAGGNQGADPHSRGTGPLPAHQTIILDVFPRSFDHHYWGDMTRTVVRGVASPAVKKLYQDVLESQELAFSMIKDGVEGRTVHAAVVDSLKNAGNSNGETSGKKTGFIHSTGHGVGLEIHELPRIGKLSCTLEAGQVVTVEPGLYYPGVGSVRLEDIVVVTTDGIRDLNRFPKDLEI